MPKSETNTENPVTMAILEQNCLALKYENTDSFLSDVKSILHNYSIVSAKSNAHELGFLFLMLTARMPFQNQQIRSFGRSCKHVVQIYWQLKRVRIASCSQGNPENALRPFVNDRTYCCGQN